MNPYIIISTSPKALYIQTMSIQNIQRTEPTNTVGCGEDVARISVHKFKQINYFVFKIDKDNPEYVISYNNCTNNTVNVMSTCNTSDLHDVKCEIASSTYNTDY